MNCCSGSGRYVDDKKLKLLPDEKKVNLESFSVVIVGESGVGKSHLLVV